MSAPAPERVYVQWYGGKRAQTWTTPRDLFERLHAEYRFTMDGAAYPDTALLPRYSSAAAPREWNGERVFCNPPWSLIRPFVDLAAGADMAVLLVPARTNARWFHRALSYGAEARFFLGRPRFGDAKANSPVDCLLLVFDSALVSASPQISRAALTTERAPKYESRGDARPTPDEAACFFPDNSHETGAVSVARRQSKEHAAPESLTDRTRDVLCPIPSV